ncbi:MAG: FAD:protein FMN transferase [Oscillospiraceae bacterium]|nr:FAD:protein FMN transferase [Oscillospiraceae bacterium]
MKRVFAFLLAPLLLLPYGCAPAQPLERTFFAMDTVMTLRLYQGGDGSLLDRAEARVRELEGLWSVTDGASEISTLNHDGSAELSPETADLLRTALDMCRRTDGALDISTYPVLRAWGFTTGEYSVPGGEAIAALLPLVDYGRVALEAGAAALPPGMEIDLGSVAKGYTGDALAALLKQGGAASALLDLGGNIQAVGSKPDGSPWRVAIRDPAGDGNIGVVEVADQAVVTSGGYERYFEEDGVRYWHIIDPATGWPARSGLASVTVVGESGLLCDGLSTALFVMGREGALEHWRQHRDFEAVLVSEDGSVTITAGLEGRFTPADPARPLTVAQP